MDPLRFDSQLLARRPTSGLDVVTDLAHFAIITYMVDPAALRPHVHPRFELDTIRDESGVEQALISVVPFLDRDFRFVRCPWPRWTFGQTNYRAYVTDRETGEHVAWFFGTVLDSVTVNIPHYAWKLPWYRGRIRFDVSHDPERGRYSGYRMSTQSRWAPAALELEDSGQATDSLFGFDDLETGMVLLTHPVKGFFHRLDGRLGTYAIWHDRLVPTIATARRASFPLLERLGLVSDGELSRIHSVMLQPEIGFTIYLPPNAVR